MAQEEPRLLNVHKAASFLGVHPNTIRRWAQENKLHGERIGTRGDWRFTREELQNMMRSNQLSEKDPEQTKNYVLQKNMQPAYRASSADFLAGGGEMGERIRAKDWSATPLGPFECWPQSLKTIVRIMLTSRQPIWIGWGPDLIKLYNDPYKAIVGGKHPEALGQPAAVVWREIWDAIGPRLETAMQQNEGTYDEALLLIMERYGYQEETYYTFSYSPVPADEGGVGGIICANTDDTQRIIGERQVKLLRMLAAETTDARTVDAACRLSAQSLQHNAHDLPFAMIYLLHQEQRTLSLAGITRIQKGHPAAPESVSLDAPTFWPFDEVVRTGEVCLIDDLAASFAELPTGAWSRPPRQAVAVPIAQSGHPGLAGILIAGLNPFRLFDETYQGFIGLVAGQIAASIANAQAYEEERKRAEALAELDRAKTLFFSNVSHEFRTPLTLMMGPIEDARNDPHTLPTNADRLAMAHRNTLRLLKLVNTLLDFSRIEAGRIEASYEPVDISAYTAELAGSFRSTLEKAGLRLLLTTPQLSEPIYLDQDMWEKIVLNLLSNAFKFTFEGEIEVTLTEGSDHVTLRVRDTGVGIAQKDLPHIFERFRRVEGVKSRSYEGSGIGLALVHELVAMHGASINVESAEGQGTTFTITLLKGTAHLPKDRINAKRTLQSTALGTASYIEEAAHWLPDTSEITPTLSADHLPVEASATFSDRPCIVLVDDNTDMRAYIKQLLSRHFEVEAVANGALALQAVQKRKPDLVLTDVMMPEMNGFELLRTLKNDPTTASIPVIMLSARAGEEATIEGVEAGADDYLVKPFSARELLARVTTHIKIARGRYEAERRLRDLFMQAPAAVIILRGPEYRITLVNPITLAIWGRKREDVMNKPFFEALPEVREQGLEPLLEGVLTTGIPYVGNELLVKLDRKGTGELEDVYFTFVYAPMRSATEQIEGIMVFAYEVTEQVLARRKVEESEERFRTLAEHIPNLVWIARPDGWTYWYNSCWYSYTGMTPEQSQGWGWSAAYDQALLPSALERWNSALQSGEPLDLISPLKGADGVFRPFLVRTVPIRNSQGKIVQWVGTATDITEQKKLEQQKDDFMGIASHELKTPVTSIKAYAQLLERRFRKIGDEQAASMLAKMDSQINRLTDLIRDLLDITRIENGKLLFHYSSFDFNTLIHEIVEETQRTTTRHRIIQYLAPSVTLCADRDRIGQVLTNLLTNAIKYSPRADSVVVKTVCRNNTIITSVQDFGIGIPVEKQQHVFERFFRVEGGAHATYSGLGLGLYITAEFVKRHGGSIWIESEEGKGSTFSFSLPYEQTP